MPPTYKSNEFIHSSEDENEIGLSSQTVDEEDELSSSSSSSSSDTDNEASQSPSLQGGDAQASSRVEKLVNDILDGKIQRKRGSRTKAATNKTAKSKKTKSARKDQGNSKAKNNGNDASTDEVATVKLTYTLHVYAASERDKDIKKRKVAGGSTGSLMLDSNEPYDTWKAQLLESIHTT